MPKNGQKQPSLKNRSFWPISNFFEDITKKYQDIEMKDHKILYNGTI